MSGEHGKSSIVAVVIGRNEGDRLIACLKTLKLQLERIVYVDSGSTDDSVPAARALGATVIVLPADTPFTAARARNAGLEAASAFSPAPIFIQFVDGDCTIAAGWVETAQAFLAATPKAAVVCGRRRERFPEASVYNRLADAEWDTPIGRTNACGGDALMRRDALEAVGAFKPTLIAGEEPELCVRFRQAGWEIWRIDAEMTLHDAAMTRFGQWWQRARRAGHAYAEGAALHGAPSELHNVAATRRAWLWGAVLPGLTLLGVSVSPWALLLLFVWPAQVLRLARRGIGWEQAVFLTLVKLPEVQGMLTYWWRRLTGSRRQLIEYK